MTCRTVLVDQRIYSLYIERFGSQHVNTNLTVLPASKKFQFYFLRKTSIIPSRHRTTMGEIFSTLRTSTGESSGSQLTVPSPVHSYMNQTCTICMNDPYILYTVDVNEVKMDGWMDEWTVREGIMVGRVGGTDKRIDELTGK